MLYKPDFRTEDNNREILLLDTEGYPFICNYSELDSRFNKGFPWHWHSAFEIDYIQEGEVELKTADGVDIVRKGEAFFINSNVMHDICITGRSNVCQTYAYIFDPHFLSGMYNSVLEQKYLIPVLKSRELQAFIIRPDHYQTLLMMEKVLNIIELNRQEPFGFELEIQAELSRFWCLLLKETEELRSRNIESNSVDIERVKAMMQFIQNNFRDKITLEDIALSANISERECARCFQRCIGMSPINYLNEYRVRMAARMLLQTEDSILTISENCGFSSSSYLGKVFHDALNCTPREYRKKNSKSS